MLKCWRIFVLKERELPDAASVRRSFSLVISSGRPSAVREGLESRAVPRAIVSAIPPTCRYRSDRKKAGKPRVTPQTDDCSPTRAHCGRSPASVPHLRPILRFRALRDGHLFLALQTLSRRAATSGTYPRCRAQPASRRSLNNESNPSGQRL